ncbi:MAG: amino acid ABC transporter permease, partial [Alphaproteobacteria bacterium]|nr:amino acid ABC transporter permease [Alphaproteobacteria bacterium]
MTPPVAAVLAPKLPPTAFHRRRPARQREGAIGWLHHHLFSSIGNTVLTLAIVALVIWLIPPFIDWAFIDAVWHGTTREACVDAHGACWPFITQRFGQIIYGFYTYEERWRPDVVYLFGAIGLAWLMIPKLPRKSWVGIFMLTAYPLVSFILLSGGWFGLPVVSTERWGGLLLTLVVAAVGIVASLPLGILLALGRRSELPVVRILCVVFIEVWRGVPMITVLFMASSMLPLFLPDGFEFDKLVRALIAVALFNAAYMAEVVRAGLQALPKGQYEGAAALGLSYWRTTILIVLPQALRIVLPGIVNNMISMFKDTSLVS